MTGLGAATEPRLPVGAVSSEDQRADIERLATVRGHDVDYAPLQQEW